MSEDVAGGNDFRRAARLIWLCDALLAVLLVGICLLLGCYYTSDSDVWWHLRGGQWIIEHFRAPGLDPFTYGSADRVWIDLHWLFEALLAVVYRFQRISGVVLLAAATGAATVATALAATMRRHSLAVSVACWVPAVLMMSVRLNPRPEMFSLLFLAVFLAVLSHAPDHPRLCWLLVPTQLLWVNVHGLFVLGPVVLTLFIVSSFVDALRRRGPWSHSAATRGRHWWWHVLGASLGVAAACFINPYGIRGALFPLELFPKISDPASPYKVYIDEFHNPLNEAHRVGHFGFDHLVYFNLLYFLLLAVPLSFLVPAIWQACRDSRNVPRRAANRPPRPALMTTDTPWLAGLVAATALLAISAAVSQIPPGSGWPSALAVVCAVAAMVLSILAGIVLWRISRPAAALALTGGTAEALAMYYLHARMSLGPAAGAWPTFVGVGAVALVVAAALTLRHGGSLFRMLVAAAFIYLAVHAMRNLNLFGLVAGVILASNVSEWLSQLLDDRPVAVRWWPRMAIAAVLVVWMLAIPTKAYREWTGDRRVFGLREPALVFPHDAARFAGRDGMPERALAYHLGLAGVYVYHNAPEKKVYMDPRLELPSRDVFETYVGIEKLLEQPGDAWVEPLERLGAGALLLDHGQHHQAEAALLAQGDWRCVYYDALASVYLSRESGSSTQLFPTVNFAERHFCHSLTPSTPADPDAAFFEGSALVNVASQLRRQPGTTWSWRIPALLRALDRIDLAEGTTTRPAELWMLRGQCHWNLVPDLSVLPPAPDDGWSIAALPWAQSTWCFRHALAVNPDHLGTLRQLYDSWRARRMRDAQLAVARQLPPSILAASKGTADLSALERELAELPESIDAESPDFGRLSRAWMARGCAATMAEMAKTQGADASRWDWELTDRMAAAWMHLGEPLEARKLWSASIRAPSEAAKLVRLADTYLVEREFAKAAGLYRQALAEDQCDIHAYWALASMHVQRAQRGPALDACRQAQRCQLSDEQRRFFDAVRLLVEPYCTESTENH